MEETWGTVVGRLTTRLRLGAPLAATVSSGASVHPAVTPGGTAVVLKVARGAALDRGRRELAFYRERSDRVPLRVPRLVEGVDTGDAVLLVLSRHPPSAPVATWGPQEWASVADDLAGLHASSLPLPARRTPEVSDGGPDRVLQEFWVGETTLLRRVWDGRAELEAAVAALPSGPVHGDLHAGNLLREGGAFVWIDWPEAGVDSPASDLGFLTARAVAEGADPPLDHVVVPQFCRRTGLDPDTAARAVLAAELLVLVTQWPPYARFGTAATVATVRRRVRHRIREW